VNIWRWKTRRRFLLVGGGLIFVVPLVLSIGCLGRLVGGKYDGPDFGHNADPSGPAPLPDTPVRVKQTLPHTCGLRAMESAYRAYGMDPEAYDIRYRLGTDFSAIPTDPDATGTLHPDILRVLAQDGFATTLIDLDEAGAADQLEAHLSQGHLALAVVYRSTYHWVLLAPPESGHAENQGELWLIDSLAEGHTEHGIAEYIQNETLSVILIRPRSASESEPSRSHQHLIGTQEMAQAYRRQRARTQSP